MRLKGIALVNRSTVTDVTPLFLQMVAAACAMQLCRDVGPAYGRTSVPVIYAESVDAVLPGYMIGYFVDTDADVPGALAYHTEYTDGSYCIFVLVRTILNNGGTVSSGGNSVAAACSHEVVEAFLNASVNGWRDDGKGGQVAEEGCDPVESDSYDIEVSVGGASGPVPVSNFVYPDWFDPIAPGSAQLDHLDTIGKPFEMSHGGYMVVRDAVGSEHQIFGESFPEWKCSLKADVGRHARARTLAANRMLAEVGTLPPLADIPSAPDTIPGKPPSL